MITPYTICRSHWGLREDWISDPTTSSLAGNTVMVGNTVTGWQHCHWLATLSLAGNTVTGWQHCHWLATPSLAGNTVTGRQHCHWQATLSLAGNTVTGWQHCHCWQHCHWWATLSLVHNTVTAGNTVTGGQRWWATLSLVHNTVTGAQHCHWCATLMAGNTVTGAQHCHWWATVVAWQHCGCLAALWLAGTYRHREPLTVAIHACVVISCSDASMLGAHSRQKMSSDKLLFVW